MPKRTVAEIQKDVPRKFDPPDLPFAWLATTFVAPTLVLVLSSIITSENISFTIRLAFSLGLLSIMLFVSCIILVFRLYSTAYTQQLLKLEADFTELKTTMLANEINRNNAEIERKSSEISKITETITAEQEAIREELAHFKDEQKVLIQKLMLSKDLPQTQEPEV